MVKTHNGSLDILSELTEKGIDVVLTTDPRLRLQVADAVGLAASAATLTTEANPENIGRRAIQLDTGDRFYWDGSAWQPEGGGAGDVAQAVDFSVNGTAVVPANVATFAVRQTSGAAAPTQTLLSWSGLEPGMVITAFNQSDTHDYTLATTQGNFVDVETAPTPTSPTGTIVIPAGEVWTFRTETGGGIVVTSKHGATAAPGTDQREVDEQCYEEPGAPFVLDQDGFADEITAAQFATLPAGPHMRWTSPSDRILDTLEINLFGSPTIQISWLTSEGDSGVFNHTGAQTGLPIPLGGIFLPAGGTIDFTIDSYSGSQMQLSPAATSIANGWTALQDYSAFATTSHWATRLLGSEAPIEYIVRTFRDGTSLASVPGSTAFTDVTGGIPAGWTLKTPEPLQYRLVDEQCYENVTGANLPDSVNSFAEDNGGNFLATTGAVAPVTSPLRLRNGTTESVFVTGFKIRFGASSYTGAGVLTINGVTFQETGTENVSGIYRTILFGNPDNGDGFEMLPGSTITQVLAVGPITNGPTQGPATMFLGAATDYFGAGNQPIMELTLAPAVPEVEEQIVRYFEDGTAIASVPGQTTFTNVSGGIPAGWTLKTNIHSEHRQVDEAAYQVPTGVRQLVTLSNRDGGPTFGPVGTSQTFFTYPQIFFDPAELPFDARIKAVRMHDERLGNNTMVLQFRYGGQATNNVGVANHPNGASPAPVEYTFPTAVPVTAGDFLQANGNNDPDIGQGAQGRPEEGLGAESPWVASITPGLATPSGGPNAPYPIAGFNAEVDFDIGLTERYIVRTYEDGTALASRPGETAVIDVSNGVPADWVLEGDLIPRVEALEAKTQPQLQAGRGIVPSTGLLSVTFSTPFEGDPPEVVVGMAEGSAATPRTVTCFNVTNTGFDVSMKLSSNGAVFAGAFSWIALGDSV